MLPEDPLEEDDALLEARRRTARALERLAERIGLRERENFVELAERSALEVTNAVAARLLADLIGERDVARILDPSS